MEPIKLTETGEMLIIPEGSGLTDESPLPADGVLGRHKWSDCNGMIHCSETAAGWTVICDCCGWQDNLPREIASLEGLRRFFAEEHAKKRAQK